MPKGIQCPNCGRYNPWQHMSYINPKTSQQKDNNGWLVGGLIGVVVFIILFILFSSISYFALIKSYGPCVSGYECDEGIASIVLVVMGGFVALFVSAITFPVYSALRQNWLRKTRIIVRRCTCPQCKNEWVVTQEPTAQKQS